MSLTRIACLVAGFLLVVLALNGPLHLLADRYLFSAHMVQHLLLTLVVPPLLLTSLPPSFMKLFPALATTLLSRLTAPIVASASYNAVLILWHVPLFYGWAMENHAVHIGEHALFLGTALLLWWPVAGPELGHARLVPPAQLLYLFLAGVPMIPIAAFMTLADEPLYPFYGDAPRHFGLSPLADQVAGGVIMSVPGSLIYLLAITVVYFRWVMKERTDSIEGLQDGTS